MKKILLLIALLAPLARAETQAAHAQIQGADHCYGFDAPPGWRLDAEALRSEGVPMVVLPAGQSWSSAPMAIYTRPGPLDGDDRDAAIARQVESTRALYPADQRPRAEKLETVAGAEGASGELWRYYGFQAPELEELVVYFPGRKTLNFFVLQLGRGADKAAGREALLAVARSYAETPDCKPCATPAASSEARP